MLDERKDSNFQENDELFQTTKKSYISRTKKINIKYSKTKISKKHK